MTDEETEKSEGTEETKQDATKTVTVESCGIKAEIDPSRLDDVRVVYAIAALEDDEATESEKMAAFRDYLHVMFAGHERRIMREIADANGGQAKNELFGQFIRDCVTAAKAKN